MSKSPAFQWYAADYLADERVIQLSLEAEGAYVRLLSFCWREGSIPANPALLAPMCKYADAKVIKAALALFTRVGAPPGRLLHKRLEEERGKQEAHRAKQAENGRAGGRPKKAVGKPDESQNNPPLFFGETQMKPNESSSISSSTSSSFSSSIEPLPSVEDAASAAAPVEEESQPVELPFESPTPGLRTPGGPADVATRKPAKTQRTAAYRDFAEPWPPALRVPWAGPEFHAAWGRWASYLANEAGKRHGGAISEQADLDQLQTKAGAGGLARALQIIDESIARSWKALIDNQPKQQPHSTYNAQAHAVYPRNTSPAARAQYVPDVDSYGSL